jgi:hypothetical protein
MAKTKGRPESISGYFRQLFESNPSLLDHGKNDVIIAQWKTDHPGQTVDDRIKGNLANTKSIMRKKFGKVKRRRKRGRPAAADGALPAVPKHRSSIAALEKMESLIDECLSVARHQANPGLDPSIRHLLAARRAVAWQMGKPT